MIQNNQLPFFSMVEPKIKALQKKLSFVFCSFAKYETMLSKFETNLEIIDSFVIEIFLRNLTKIFAKLSERKSKQIIFEFTG